MALSMQNPTSTMEKAPSTTIFDSLPPELIHSILDFVDLEPPSIGETRPVAYDSLSPGEDWYNFTRNRRTLLSLCRTSSQFLSYAQPRLYKTVVILDEESLVLFFRTIAGNAELTPLTRFFSCHITLTRQPVARNIREALAKHCDRSATAGLRVYRFSNISDRTPEGVMCFILLHLHRLETLLLQVPICDDYQEPEYTTLLTDLMIARNHFPDPPLRHSVRVINGLSEHPIFRLPPKTPFMHLKTLMLQGDPEMREYFENEGCDEVPESWGVATMRYLPLCWISPKLTTLEISSDDGIFDFPDVSFAAAGLSLDKIRHVYLHDSVTSPHNLYRLLKNVPKLETLYLTARLDDGPLPDLEYMEYDNSSEAHPESLDAALTKYGQNLRHLDVGWFEIFGLGSLIGAGGRLSTLPKLKKLEKLCIQLSVLYGSEVAPVPLANLLPPNLIELTLADWWWTDIDAYDEMQDWTVEERLKHYRSKKDYRANALKNLIQYAADSLTSQPKLKKLLLLCHIPWTWTTGGGMELDFHFDEVKKAFQKRGVEFQVGEA
ncbi:hypothetical protein V8F20_002943 [Naviculisporaceae sp. PSN 640]